MSTHSLTWRRRWLTVSIGALIASAVLACYLFAPTSVDALPPRPTPAITPTHTLTPTPSPRTPRPTPSPLRLSHIRLVVTPARDGLWSVVEWQGSDGTWHIVEGWQGAIEAGSKRWAVYERNFGEGPFRWMIYETPAGAPVGQSLPFTLPVTAGEELTVHIKN
ncbi:MAG: hypothetical protein ACK47M_00010 [Caldilinea sp.]